MAKLSVKLFCVLSVGGVLLQMIQQLCTKHWCAVPLLFLSQALAKLPPSPLLGVDGLAALRYPVVLTVALCHFQQYFHKKLILTGVVSQGGAALHHDHSSSPAERRCSVLPAEQRPPSHRCGKTQVVYTEPKQHLKAEVFKLCVF